MGRIRSLKPEFCGSEDIAVLSIPCRLHFAMLWTYVDDAGKGVDNSLLIKAALWPLDEEIDRDQVEEWQAELARQGRIRRYEVDGKRYFLVDKFAEHQHPNRPQKSKIPDPGEGGGTAHVQSSVNTQQQHEQHTAVVEGLGEVEVEVGESRMCAPALAPSGFDAFWSEYPRKHAESETRKAWRRALGNGARDFEIIGGLRRWCAYWLLPGNETYTPYPVKWLNEQTWQTDTPPLKASLTTRASSADEAAANLTAMFDGRKEIA